MKLVLPLLMVAFATPANGQLNHWHNQVWSLNTPGLQQELDREDSFGQGTLVADFNGDGLNDLAVTRRRHRVGGVQSFDGTVSVIYAGPGGKLSAAGSQHWTFVGLTNPDLGQSQRGFGWAIAAGDFNGDNRADLAIGAPFSESDSTVYAGEVLVLYGGNSGLSASSLQRWNLSGIGELEPEALSQLFGSSLAAGDFDGNGKDDLAIGIPGLTINGVTRAGAVGVIYGANDGSGLSSQGRDLWSQDELVGTLENFDHFGTSLATGDFDGNGKDDLAVGQPSESISAVEDAGSVNIIYAADDGSGLSVLKNQGWSQDELAGEPEENDSFGAALATGDFDGNGKDDLAIGVHWEDVGDIMNAGAVNIVYAADNGSGLSLAGNQIWTQDSTGIQGSSEPQDSFGQSLVVADFDGDGMDDLAVGVPEENLDGVIIAGAVNVIYAASNGSGLQAGGNQFLDRRGAILGTPSYRDHFGFSLASGDLDGDGGADLVVGVTGSLAGEIAAGSVNIIFQTDTLFMDGSEDPVE